MKVGALISLTLLGAGVIAVSQDRRPVGERIRAADQTVQDHADVGFAMFAIRWVPDRGRRFNDVSCLLCHNAPTIGGRGSDPRRAVFFAPDSGTPSGTTNFQRQEGRIDAPVLRREIPKDARERKSPALFGLGFVDAIKTEDILKNADPTDANGDGISGRTILVNGQYGRFGWKGDVVNLKDFVHSAFLTELGLGLTDPEKNVVGNIDGYQMDGTWQYLRLLAYPIGPPEMIRSAKGEAAFNQIGCGTCHTPSFTTGPSDLPELANKKIFPYSNFLLHDLGDGGPLHTTPKQPTPSEFRTPPLWGFGSVPGPYMNDNSAKTLEEAIEKHGGEAAASREKYRALPASEKVELQKFLESL